MWGSKFAAVAKRLWGLIYTRICCQVQYVLIFTHLFVHSVRSDNLLSLRSIPVALALSRVLQIAGLGGAKAQGRLRPRWKRWKRWLRNQAGGGGGVRS